MFHYVVPAFDVITLPLRPLKFKCGSPSTEGDEEIEYDIFVRNCPLLDKDYPAVMLVMDMLIIKVNNVIHAQVIISQLNILTLCTGG